VRVELLYWDGCPSVTETRELLVRNALDAVLAGQEPLPNETPAVGCSVKWRA